MRPVSIQIAAATITAGWFVALAWRVWGPSFVRGMTSQEPLTEGEPS